MDGNENNDVTRILSIDFDYIMYPCIRLYNELVSGNENPTATWNAIEQRIGIGSFLSYDVNALKEIADLVKKNVRNGAVLVPIVEHQEIIDTLKGEKDWEDSIYQVCNIDFHHDLSYRPEDAASIMDFDQYDCSNWLGYLYWKKKLKECIWLKAPNSDLFDPEQFPDVSIYGRHDFHKVGHDFQYVFLCLSPQWVPHKYRHLYDLIIEMLKNDGADKNE